jgi:hypothetical protein
MPFPFPVRMTELPERLPRRRRNGRDFAASLPDDCLDPPNFIQPGMRM